jgi:hypothetical protein
VDDVDCGGWVGGGDSNDNDLGYFKVRLPAVLSITDI